MITIEAWKRTTIRCHRPTSVAWCERCSAETTMLSPDDFARMSKTTPRNVYRAIEDGTLHFAETPDGLALVCSNSLTHTIKGVIL